MPLHRYSCSLTLLIGALIGLASVDAATFTVDSLLDFTDDNPGDGKCESLRGNLGDLTLYCTLRGAIEEANALAGTDNINFSVAGTIRPATPLPPIAERANIQGHTAPGAPPLTSSTFQPPVVVIDGDLYRDTVSHGLAITSTGFLSTVSNVSIVNVLGPGILVEGNGSKIYGCWLGIDPDRSVGSNSEGIRIAADDLEIGNSRDFGSGNVIASNSGSAIVGLATSGSVIGGNHIGIGDFRLSPIPNGVSLASETILLQGNDNLIGGRRNTIVSGQGSVGVFLRGNDNRVEGNDIGVNADLNIFRSDADVILIDGSGNTIGTPGAGNIIAGGLNGVAVVPLSGGTKSGNAVVANEIYSNSADGVAIRSAVQSTVDDNLIAGNGGAGIRIDAVGTSRVENNVLEKNDSVGIHLIQAESAVVENNDIGGSGGPGLLLERSRATTVRNNRIGLPRYQGAPVVDPNDGDGIRINGGDSLVVENHEVTFNVIANNSRSAVSVVNSSGNELRFNEMVANAAMGIDLNADGPTVNDNEDADDGANQTQNYPDLTATLLTGPVLRITASMDSAVSNSAYPMQVDVYLGAGASPEQGQVYVGGLVLEGPGPADFNDYSLADGTPGGFAVATATDADGNTSEFSPPLIFGTPELPDELFLDGFEGP